MQTDKKILRYHKMSFLGEGQFGTVSMARDDVDGKIVAIKKMKLNASSRGGGVDPIVMREINMLRKLSHENIIELLDVISDRPSISLVFEVMDTDLDAIIKNMSICLTQANVKAYMLMILHGLEHIHSNGVLHRDLKPNNLLINAQGVLKIADFGLANTFGTPDRLLTHQVVTRWYRAPELLFGARHYGTSIDMWAVGCVLAELLLRSPLFPGSSDLDQLTRIFQVVGTPNEEIWPNVSQLPYYVIFKTYEPIDFHDIFLGASYDLVEFVECLLALNPSHRCNTSEALTLPYFSNEPAPTACADLPMPTSGNQVIEGRTSRKRKHFGSAEGSPLVKKLF